MYSSKVRVVFVFDCYYIEVPVMMKLGTLCITFNLIVACSAAVTAQHVLAL
jgi:hypothetical protein